MTVEICTGSMSKRKKEGEEEVNTYTYILVLSSIYIHAQHCSKAEVA